MPKQLNRDETRAKISRFIEDYYTRNDKKPAIRDIAAGTGISVSSVFRILHEMEDDGTVKVLNSGKRNGEATSARGKAHLKDPDAKPLVGELRVTFFWPFYADYRIIELAPDYSYAVVTAGSRDYFWVLSRKPTMPKEQLDGILDRAKAWGFDLGELEYPAPVPDGK